MAEGGSEVSRRAITNLTVLIISVLVSLLIGEIIVRIGGETDENGQFYFMDRPLKPYELPVSDTEELIDAYLESTTSYHMYDPRLGWNIRPEVQSEDGLYRSNATGLRSDVEYDLTRPPDVVRIAIFGDSFTHGSDQPLEESWGYLLEKRLRDQGLDVEVMNFGVGGYGTDQAFLRWKYEGSQYSPQLVLLGFRVENVFRNLNVVRSIYRPGSGIPFSKPRFVLEGETLELVNSPTVPPEEMPALLGDFVNSPLADLEYHFQSEDYTHYWWLNSRLLSFALELGEETKATDSSPRVRREGFFDLDGEPVQLTLKIIEDFEVDVEAQGAEFVIVYLPTKQYLRDYRKDRPIEYADLLAYLDEHHTVVHPEKNMFGQPVHAYWDKHYSFDGSKAISKAIDKQISDQVSVLMTASDADSREAQSTR